MNSTDRVKCTIFHPVEVSYGRYGLVFSEDLEMLVVEVDHICINGFFA